MNKERNRKEFERMHKELTDPALLDESRRRTERAKRIEERKKDTGI